MGVDMGSVCVQGGADVSVRVGGRSRVPVNGRAPVTCLSPPHPRTSPSHPTTQLTNLIRDTVWLKSYLSAVLRVEAEAFSGANLALGQMKAALPAALPPPLGVGEMDSGAVGAGSLPDTPEGIAAAAPPHMQVGVARV